MKKKLYTREEFEQFRQQKAQEMFEDKPLQRQALEVLVKADHYNWIHQTTWMGEPILQLPQDMFALQEIIYSSKPDYIVEVGVAWAGSLLFYSTLMEVLGGKQIIGIDIYIPDDLKRRIADHKKLAKRITWIQGSSLEDTTIHQVKRIIGKSKKVMVLLDSFHTHEHVLAELNLYSPLVGKGCYIICADTVVEDIPAQTHRPRPWGPGNNPRTAMLEFLAHHPEFKIDDRIKNKLLFSCNADGYLARM